MKNAYKTLLDKLKVKDQSKDLGVDGREIFELIFWKLGWDVNWINLGQDRVRWVHF
jgi:hypothetical protein